MTHRHIPLPTIGWREWVGLPAFGVERIKAKIDTGARSSALHAFDVHEFERDGRTWVRFEVHPLQRDTHTTVPAEAELFEYRNVKSSSGRVTRRPVVLTPVSAVGVTWTIELTLASRDTMGFRMLLGRQAVRDRFLVDPGNSYFGGKPPRRKRKKAVKKTPHRPRSTE